MTVERLVQEYGVERTDIFIAAGGPKSAGEELSGGREASSGDRDDAALNGSIEVSVDLEDENLATRVREAFAEWSASDVEED